MAFVSSTSAALRTAPLASRQRPGVCMTSSKSDDKNESDGKNESGVKNAVAVEETAAASASTECVGCGRAEGPVSGCSGEGRIIGGLGAVLKWWPIKAYRPCPDYLKANKTYRRAGQSLDEIAFGRGGAGDDVSISDRLRGK